jgi:Holliday junction resolvase RusA-like endonuclease
MRRVLQEVISIPDVVDITDKNGRVGDCFFPDAVPLKAVIKFFIPRPNSHFGKNCRRSADNFTDMATIARRDHISRPDLDNMVKFVLDAMQGVVYNNDSHIVSLFASKSFDNRGGCNGRISIEVTCHGENHESDYDNSEEEVVILDNNEDDNEDDD